MGSAPGCLTPGVLPEPTGPGFPSGASKDNFGFLYVRNPLCLPLPPDNSIFKDSLGKNNLVRFMVSGKEAMRNFTSTFYKRLLVSQKPHT